MTTVELRFELLGLSTQDLKSYSIQSDYLTSTDAFSVTLYRTDPTALRSLELQPVELVVDGNTQMLGRVDRSTRGGDGTAVSLDGRDYLSDMVECRVDPSVKLNKSTTLEAALLQAAGPVGITSIKDEADVALRNVRTGRSPSAGAPPGFKEAKLDEYKVNPGEGMFAYMNRVTARQGATMQPSTKRNEIVLATPNYFQSTLYRLQRKIGPGNASNNVKTSTATKDLSSFPTFIMATGKQGRGGAKRSAMSSVFELEFPAIDPDGTLLHKGRIKPGSGETPTGLYRLLFHRDEEARDQAQLDRVATRLLSERLKDTLSYEATVQGHTDPESGATWAIDTIVEVDDDVADVHEKLWIHSRTFSYENGAVTKLRCWRVGSFIL